MLTSGVNEPTRQQVDALTGATILEFGAAWCGFCRAARPLIDQALSEHPSIRHIQIEDSRGKPLGRSFRVKLWPTFVFLRDGTEVARLVRPHSASDIRAALQQLLA